MKALNRPALSTPVTLLVTVILGAAAPVGIEAAPRKRSDERSKALLSDAEPPLTAYRIGEADVAGPFTPEIPADLVEQGSLPALGYRTPLEAIAERFHASPSLIQRLNPGARFGAGDTLQVPSVDPLVLPAYSGVRKPQEAGATPAGRIVVDTETSALTAYDQQGALLLHVPVTTGSEHDPLPVGEWKVLGVFWMPKFHYNPALFWDADPAHAKTTIAPGPNNPVGVAWIDINKEHYGLHGTPEPGTIGHRTSHGCIRMTNWDVLRVASLVTKGTVVIFQ